MSMRDFALLLAIVMTVPAVALIIRDAVGAADSRDDRLARTMHGVWTAVPVIGLVALFVWAVRA
ncbi:MAG TPA: hypothetical protein PKE32_03125 [Miltoncostaeaceae bacterium]|nr:hypothetical protein [Miltoncostaeaceae bacterium]